jgi:hypothetical protein
LTEKFFEFILVLVKETYFTILGKRFHPFIVNPK